MQTNPDTSNHYNGRVVNASQSVAFTEKRFAETIQDTELKRGKKGQQPGLSFSFFLGVVLVTLLILQYLYPQKLSPLNVWQMDNLYKQLSGFAILTFTLYQWRLTHLRSTGQTKKLKNAFRNHQWMGVFVPILLLLHALESGYAYQTWLLYGFIALVIVGLFNYQAFKIRQKWYIQGWLVLHISLATVCLTLTLYHAYISYSYSS